MRLYVDVEKGRFVQAPGVGIVQRPFQFKRGDGGLLEIEFIRGLSVVDLGADFAVKFGVKLPGRYDEDPLVFHETFEKVGTVYVGEPSFNTVALNAALEKDSDPENDVDSVDVILEVTWSIDAGLTWLSTDTVRGVIFNDVVRGDETLPVRGYQQVVQATNIFTVFADADVGAMLLSFDRGGIYSPTGVFFSSAGTYDQDEAATALAGLINAGDHGVTAVAAGPYVTVTATDLGPDGNGILCGISTGSEFGEWTYTETRGGTEGLVLRAIEQALTDEEKLQARTNIGLPFPVDVDGDIIVSMKLADVTGTIPDAHVLARRGSAIVKGDGVTTGGILVESPHNEITMVIVGSNNAKFYYVENTFGAVDGSVTYASIGTAVSILGANVFSGTGITAISIPNSVVEFEEYCFASSSLTSIKIPDSVTTLGESCLAFTPLTTITIPASVTSIGDSVFEDCSNLVEVNCFVPETVFGAGANVLNTQGLPITLHVRSDDNTWDALVAASPSSYQGNTVTVVKDL